MCSPWCSAWRAGSGRWATTGIRDRDWGSAGAPGALPEPPADSERQPLVWVGASLVMLEEEAAVKMHLKGCLSLKAVARGELG